ncbi:MAG: hypothetical protein GY765_32695 [bacterium]|nr:hypothetical protein [bacterium]
MRKITSNSQLVLNKKTITNLDSAGTIKGGKQYNKSLFCHSALSCPYTPACFVFDK